MIAAKLGTGLTAHCVDLLINDDKLLEQRIPAYGGHDHDYLSRSQTANCHRCQGSLPTPGIDFLIEEGRSS